MKGLNLWILIVIFCWAGGISTAYAQPELKSPPGKWWKDRQLIDELRLTPDQQSRIESLWMEDRLNLIDQRAELEKQRIELSDLISKDSINEAAAVKAFEKVQAARIAIERSTFLLRVRIKNILSAEQQQQLEEIAARMERRQGMNRGRPPAPNAPRIPRRLEPPPMPQR